MKIIHDTKQSQGDEVRQEQVAKQQKEYHLIGKQRKIAGHTLFEFDKRTKEIRPAAIAREAVMLMNGGVQYKTRTDIHNDCFYLQALNIKNAEKKLRKLGLL